MRVNFLSPYKTYLLVISLFLLMGLFVAGFLSLEFPLHAWDTRGYWTQFQNMGALLLNNPFEWLLENIAQTEASDYGPWITSLLFPFYLLLGGTRFSYIWGSSLYLLVTVFFVSSFSRQFLNPSPEKEKRFFLPFLLPFTFVPFWKPILYGLPDIAGLIPILATLLFVSKQDLGKSFSLKKAIILGILLWLPFFARRWYAYTVVSLYLSLPFLNWALFTSRSELKKFKKIFTIGLHFGIAGIVSGILVVLFQFFLAVNILSTNYSEVYSAYANSFFSVLLSIIYNVGWLPFILILVSLGFSLFKQSKTSLYSLFFSFNFLFTLFLFTRTQGMGLQHILPLCLWLILIFIQGAYLLLNASWVKPYETLLDYGLSGLSILVLVVSFFPLPESISFKISLLPDKFYPYQTENSGSYRAFANFLEERISPQNKVAIVNDSGSFNVQTLASLTEERTNDSNLFVSQLDLRDHWDLNFLQARYLVITDREFKPVGLENFSNVLSLPVLELRSGEGIGTAYRKLPESFKVDEGTAFIYEKIRPLTEEEIQTFLFQLINIYPDWQNFYDHPLVYSFLSSPDLNLGSGYARFYLSTGFGLSVEGDKVVVLVPDHSIHWEINSFPSNKMEIERMSGFLGKVNKVIDRLIQEGKDPAGLIAWSKKPINSILGFLLGNGKEITLTLQDETGRKETIHLSPEDNYLSLDMDNYQGKRVWLTLVGSNKKSPDTVFIRF